MDYKAEHEAFVSGLSGSSIWVVIYIGFVIVLINTTRQSVDGKSNALASFLLDILFLVLPMLILVSYPMTYAIWMCIIFIMIIITFYQISKSKKPSKTLTDRNKLPFITAYRSSLLLLTAIAILAVDFKIFPRYFAKTETFGYSLVNSIKNGSFIDIDLSF